MKCQLYIKVFISSGILNFYSTVLLNIMAQIKGSKSYCLGLNPVTYHLVCMGERICCLKFLCL